MYKLALSLVMAFLITALSAPSAFAGCGPDGYCTFGGCHSYGYLANTDFGSSCAWSYVNASRVASNMCSVYPGGYGSLVKASPSASRIYQTVYVPTSSEPDYVSNSTSWVLGFGFESSGTGTASDTLQVQIYDNDTNTLITSSTIVYGNDGHSCQTYTNAFTANLNGKNVRFEIHANIVTTGFTFHVTDVGLDQYY